MTYTGWVLGSSGAGTGVAGEEDVGLEAKPKSVGLFSARGLRRQA